MGTVSATERIFGLVQPSISQFVSPETIAGRLMLQAYVRSFWVSNFFGFMGQHSHMYMPAEVCVGFAPAANSA